MSQFQSIQPERDIIHKKMFKYNYHAWNFMNKRSCVGNIRRYIWHVMSALPYKSGEIVYSKTRLSKLKTFRLAIIYLY